MGKFQEELDSLTSLADKAFRWRSHTNFTYAYPGRPTEEYSNEAIPVRGQDNLLYFIVVGTGDYNVVQVDDHGCTRITLCAAPTMVTPWPKDSYSRHRLSVGERNIGQYLQLKFDTAGFRKTANISNYARVCSYTQMKSSHDLPPAYTREQLVMLNTSCPWETCGARRGERCRTRTGRPAALHKVRSLGFSLGGS